MKKVLVVAGWYLPGYKAGGPIRTISNLVDYLGDELDFYLLTRDTDFGQTEPYLDIHSDIWLEVGKAQVMYLSKERRNLFYWLKTIRQLDIEVIYLNSFLDTFTINTVLLRRFGLLPNLPLIIAPRGEFSKSSLSKKSWKKKPYILFSKLLGLFDNVIWHASTEYEAIDIRRTVDLDRSGSQIRIASNLSSQIIELSDKMHILPKESGFVRIIFLSRIASIKNLDFALAILTKVRISGIIRFEIYGPLEDPGYWEQCLEISKNLPNNIQMTYHGPVDAENVSDVVTSAHVFLLPTKSENYGHVIIEALKVGRPVLISDRTPWQDLEAKNAGWVLPLEQPERFIEMISQITLMNQIEFEKWSQGAYQYAQSIIHDPARIEANRELFFNTDIK